MSILGLGVMIHSLSNRGNGYEEVEPLLGKVIESAVIVNRDELRLTVGGRTIFVSDEGQSCCEDRYLHTDDILRDYIGAVLIEFNLEDAPDAPANYGNHEVQFLRVKTSKGIFTVETHNEHNGYYGGFAIMFRVRE